MKESVPSITPAVHLEFIQNQASLTESQGAEQIEAYHRALFLHQHAGDLERFQQQIRIHTDRLSHLETRLHGTQARLTGVDRLIPVNVDGAPDTQPTAPWNRWDRAMFVAAIVGIIALLAFGVLNISFNLLESGLVTFVQNPIRAYFWAALLPVGALCVKIGWDFIQSQRLRRWYVWLCLVLGVGGVIVWVGAYAAVYPALSKTIGEHIQTLSVFSASEAGAGSEAAAGRWVDAITVAAQATAEIFLSAVLGIYLTLLYARHRPVRLAGNPLFLQLDEERTATESAVARERLALGEARGNQARLENQMTALVAYARSLFEKEAAGRRDQSGQRRVLLEQISDQLRAQLAAIDNGHGHHGARNPAAQILGTSNGQ